MSIEISFVQEPVTPFPWLEDVLMDMRYLLSKHPHLVYLLELDSDSLKQLVAEQPVLEHRLNASLRKFLPEILSYDWDPNSKLMVLITTDKAASKHIPFNRVHLIVQIGEQGCMQLIKTTCDYQRILEDLGNELF